MTPTKTEQRAIRQFKELAKLVSDKQDIELVLNCMFEWTTEPKTFRIMRRRLMALRAAKLFPQHLLAIVDKRKSR